MPNFIPKKVKRDENGNIIYSSLKRKTPLRAKGSLKAKPKSLGDTKPRKRQKSQKTLIKELDKVFSLFIRLRDSKQFGFRYFICPTCGRTLPFEKADCSHYWSRSNMNTRFDEMNCVAECGFDNRFNSSHLIVLGKFLERKYGPQKMALLEIKAKTNKKWECWELEQLIKYYKARIEEMKQTRLNKNSF